METVPIFPNIFQCEPVHIHAQGKVRHSQVQHSLVSQSSASLSGIFERSFESTARFSSFLGALLSSVEVIVLPRVFSFLECSRSRVFSNSIEFYVIEFSQVFSSCIWCCRVLSFSRFSSCFLDFHLVFSSVLECYRSRVFE